MTSQQQQQQQQQQLSTSSSPVVTSPALAHSASSSASAGSFCFSPESFASASFDVDSFIAAQRSAVSLERLAADLQTYQRHLKNELVELINRDYADFINLSTNLAGMDKAIEQIRGPVLGIREDVVKTRQALHEIIGSLERKLEERTAIREKKAILQLLLNIGDSVRKAEELLNVGDGPRSSASDPTAAAADDTGDSGHLTERVAIVFNQLLFYASQAKGLPFLNNMQPRIARITDLLKQSLEAAFVDGIRQNDTERLTQSLRTYALIDCTAEAEKLYRRVVVAPFVTKTITSENLDTLAMGGRSKQDALASLYQDVINFIRMDRASVLTITKGVLRGTGFDLYSNAVWPEVVAAISKNLANIFNAGIPEVFHKNYTHTMTFVSDFEGQLSSLQSLQTLRSHPSYVEFMQRWQQRQLPIYYQIRFKELATLVEDTLQRPESARRSTETNTNGFLLPATAVVYSSIERCWHKDVFLFGLSHRFWKLTLQFLARYQTWVESIVPELKDADDKTQERKPGTTATDVLVWVFLDLQTLVSKVQTYYSSKIAGLLPPSLANTPALQASLKISQDRLSSRLPVLSSLIVQQLVGKSSESLAAIRSIPSMYRMTNREAPTRASAYVDALLAPIMSFTSTFKTVVTVKDAKDWTTDAVQQICQRYFALTSELLQTVKKTEDSLLRLKKTKRKTATAGDASGGADSLSSDEDKIRLQLQLDIAQFGVEIGRLGIDASTVVVYFDLQALIANAIKNSSKSAQIADAGAADTTANTDAAPTHDSGTSEANGTAASHEHAAVDDNAPPFTAD